MAGDIREWQRQVEERLRQRAAQVLLALATDFQGEAKKDLSVPYPPASKVGQFPAYRTGNLRDAVVVSPATLAEITQRQEVRVGVLASAAYLVPLVRKRGRLGLLDSYRKARSRLQRLRRWLGG